LHHFIADGVWAARPVEIELLVQADRHVGGHDAVLVIDDTAIPKGRLLGPAMLVGGMFLTFYR
jgi:hypothetical protein